MPAKKKAKKKAKKVNTKELIYKPGDMVELSDGTVTQVIKNHIPHHGVVVLINGQRGLVDYKEIKPAK